jgi:hypothetical protein
MPRLLDDNIEKIKVFNSKNGMAATALKLAKEDADSHLSNNMGVAIVCKPHQGILRPHEVVEVTMMVYNELAGFFKDTLVSEVKGLEPQEFPIELLIRGSPLMIPTDQVGLNVSEQPYLLDFGGMLINSQPLQKTLKLDNIGTRPLRIELSVYNLDDMDPLRDEFSIKIADPIPGSGQLALVKFDPIQPNETNKEPFSLSSNNIIIPPKSNVLVTVSYYSETIKVFNSVLVAKPVF